MPTKKLDSPKKQCLDAEDPTDVPTETCTVAKETTDVPTKQCLGGKATDWLREYLTDEYFCGYSNPSSQIGWIEHIAKLPRDMGELKTYVVEVAEAHQERHYGSYELQCMIGGINKRGDGGDSGFCTDLVTAVNDSAVLTEDNKKTLTDQLRHCYDLFEFKIVTDKDGGPAKRAVLLKHSLF